MASSIPYDDPSLVLGNIVDTRVLDLLNQINSVQSGIDTAHQKLNSLIMMKRSLAMTINELTDMNVDVSAIKAKLGDLDTSITEAASGYMTISISSEEKIEQLREQLGGLETGESLESPLDYSSIQIKKLPLYSESLKLDAQYFSFGSNLEDDTISSIEKYVRESTSSLGSKSGDIAKTAASQISQQRQNHNLAGTLIITATCTHRNVSVIDPFTLDVDKAIGIWNSINVSDKINTSDPNSLNSASGTSTRAENNITVVSGVVYGSSFVGMVHLIKTDASAIGPSQSLTSELNEKLKIGGWLENATGGFGVEPSILDEVKKLLSTQSISSHLSLIVMGALPSIASSELQLGVRKLIQPDIEELNKAMLLSVSSTDNNSLNTGSEEGKVGNRVLNIQNSATKSLIRGLADIDQGKNKVLDINSMMSAFENYLAAIKDPNQSIGVPINFYLKKIPKSHLIKLWIDKYDPGKENGTAKQDK